MTHQTTPKRADGSREAFEKECREAYPHLPLTSFYERASSYSDMRTDFAWIGWKLAYARVLREAAEGPARMTADEAWQDLCEKDDRTSIDYPGFALIRQDELAAYMAAAPVSPAADSGDAWLIFYHDPDVRPEIFMGEGAEAAARASWEQAQINWTCDLFRSVRRDEALSSHTPAPQPFDPATSPGMTDMMVDPDTLEAFMEANPLPEEPAPQPGGAGCPHCSGTGQRQDKRTGKSYPCPRCEPSPSQGNAGAEADKTLADQREANLRARLDKIHSYAGAIETLAKGGALPLPTPAGES